MSTLTMSRAGPTKILPTDPQAEPQTSPSTPPPPATSGGKHDKNYVVRHATPADAPSLCTLARTTYLATFITERSVESMLPYLDATYNTAQVTFDMHDPETEILLAFASEADADRHEGLLGFVMLSVKGRDVPWEVEALAEKTEGESKLVELQRLYISTSHLRQSIGESLVRAAEQQMRERGYAFMWLGVSVENVAAKRAYAKYGYTKIAERPYVEFGRVTRAWQWRMVKDLRDGGSLETATSATGGDVEKSGA